MSSWAIQMPASSARTSTLSSVRRRSQLRQLSEERAATSGDLDVLSTDGTSLAAHVELQDSGRDHEGTHLIAAVFRPLHGSRQPQLERSLSLLQATFESTADGLLIVDRGGKIVVFNRRFAKMWDLTPETLATRDDAAALTEPVAKVKDPQAFLERDVPPAAVPLLPMLGPRPSVVPEAEAS